MSVGMSSSKVVMRWGMAELIYQATPEGPRLTLREPGNAVSVVLSRDEADALSRLLESPDDMLRRLKALERDDPPAALGVCLQRAVPYAIELCGRGRPCPRHDAVPMEAV